GERRAHERADGDRHPLGRLRGTSVQRGCSGSGFRQGSQSRRQRPSVCTPKYDHGRRADRGLRSEVSLQLLAPDHAIRHAGLANNAAISAQPPWEPLLVTPPHPEYPSAHCLGAGAAVAVLQDIFGGDKLAASYIYPALGVVRRWESFSQIAKEVEDARVWGGIHYRTAVEHGTHMGRQIAEFALKSKMRLATN